MINKTYTYYFVFKLLVNNKIYYFYNLEKTIAILFIFIFLCANTEIEQLLKLPNLVEHFTEHHDHDVDKQGISFLEFITIHYNYTQHHSN